MLQNITKIYGEQKAVDNVSFSIDKGEIVGFLGPNGAGKSTTMKIITCFLPPTSGTGIICGHDLDQESIKVREKIGYLPEHNPLYLDMYVKEYLHFAAGVAGIKNNIKSRVKSAVERVGLEKEQKKKIGALSKGYRQRVGLAQAIIHDPEVLILDEPTSGLDPNQLVEIRNLIKEVGKDKTVLMSTHIMQEVQAMCNRTIIINNGQIVADDNTNNLKSNAAEKFVIKVEFDKSVDVEQLKSLGKVYDVLEIGQHIYQITAEKDLRKEVSSFANKNALNILTLQKEEQGLEDTFRDLTK